MDLVDKISLWNVLTTKDLNKIKTIWDTFLYLYLHSVIEENKENCKEKIKPIVTLKKKEWIVFYTVN